MNSNTTLQHHGVLGMKWGIRKEQRARARIERKDIKWVKKNQNRIKKTVEKQIRGEVNKYVQEELNKSYRKYNVSGKLNSAYINAYNKKLATLMNDNVEDIPAPSGRVVRFVAKRGSVGVYTALADQRYNINQLKNGVFASGKVAYKQQVVSKTEMEA